MSEIRSAELALYEPDGMLTSGLSTWKTYYFHLQREGFVDIPNSEVNERSGIRSPDGNERLCLTCYSALASVFDSVRTPLCPEI